MHDSPTPALEVRLKFRLCNVSNQIIHVVIGIKNCEVGGTQEPLGYVSALGATRLMHWLILVAP